MIKMAQLDAESAPFPGVVAASAAQEFSIACASWTSCSHVSIATSKHHLPLRTASGGDGPRGKGGGSPSLRAKPSLDPYRPLPTIISPNGPLTEARTREERAGGLKRVGLPLRGQQNDARRVMPAERRDIAGLRAFHSNQASWR